MQTKEMKGITLVALVVTIVVLLILAGVSINLIIRDGGIFSLTNKEIFSIILIGTFDIPT